MIIAIVSTLAAAITVLICWYFKMDPIGGTQGMHSGWGFEIFVGVFAALYVPIAMLRRRAKQRRDQGRAGRS